MDKPISVGDLVQCVRPHCECGAKSHIGKIFVVKRIEKGDRECMGCHQEDSLLIAFDRLDPSDGRWFVFPVYSLKRIPPLSELEGEKRETSIPDLVAAIKRDLGIQA